MGSRYFVFRTTLVHRCSNAGDFARAINDMRIDMTEGKLMVSDKPDVQFTPTDSEHILVYVGMVVEDPDEVPHERRKGSGPNLKLHRP